ncbi:hypothetical protein [Streptomyces sp. MJP52]|uniref:hypothetical protein n=1 Tax=Streptomyces sp. MJP52 TaxID=2940555 RepID=UPI00247426D7|nr:hypothetical protein [Streptomyces sp. MJP52]MDH6223677.1 hypothetical protein [Streptomyces sp. MJP52]
MTVTDHPAQPAQNEPSSRWPGDGGRYFLPESPFGPSLALQKRALPGWEKFLRSAQADQQAFEEPEAEPEIHTEEDHPLLHRMVRDIASRSEGELRSVVRERHAGRVIRVAHIQPVNGVGWSTAAENVWPA